jgi:hypothetical protein
MLLGSAMYAEGKLVQSGLVLSLATNLKLFPFTLALCFLTDLKRKYWLAFWTGLLIWFLLPGLVIGLQQNFRILGEWLDLMSWDQTRNLEMLDIGHFLEMHFGVDQSIRNPLAVLVGLLIGTYTFYFFRRGKRALVHRFLLPINGLYVLLFSYLSESPTSVLAVVGIFLIGIEAVNDNAHSRIYWLLWLVALASIPIFYSDLVPKSWSQWGRAFHLKTVGYIFVAFVNIHILYKWNRR